MRKHLDSLRDRKYRGVAELANESARIISGSGPLQEKATVTEVPDERTIRYYLTEGLISPAEEKQGTASVFNYRHLLQVLVIKKLQSEHLPIRKIKEIVSDRKERDLERLLGDEDSTKNEATRYLQNLLVSSLRAIPPPAAPRGNVGGLNSSGVPTMASAPLYEPPIPTAAVPTITTGSWERIEVEPGLELHVRSDYRPPVESRGVRHLSRAILSAIINYGQKPRK